MRYFRILKFVFFLKEHVFFKMRIGDLIEAKVIASCFIENLDQ